MQTNNTDRLFFYIATLGCKVNQHESQQMAEWLRREGMEQLYSSKGADVIIINSCTVTHTADQKTRQMLHRMRRENPDAVICVSGCVPQARPEKVASLGDADIIIGNSNRESLPELIRNYIADRTQLVNIQPHSALSGLSGGIVDFGERTRAYIKIEDGCNRFCAYCIIPYARGRVRSRAIDDIRSEAASLASAGYKEAVLVGINLSAYGQDCGLTLADAVDAVACAEGIERIRLGSVEPDLLTPELIERLAAEPKFCPQFHMSIQSGCDATLRRMNRRYTTSDYSRIVAAIREQFDNPSITTDIMVGFPGETDEEFASSISYFRQVGFARAHCFVYSRREGTPAASMPDQVKPEIQNLRAEQLRAAAELCSRQFISSQTGTVGLVLAEKQRDDGMWEGYTKNYTPVRFSASVNRGDIVRVRITSVCGDVCLGELCDE